MGELLAKPANLLMINRSTLCTVPGPNSQPHPKSKEFRVLLKQDKLN